MAQSTALLIDAPVRSHFAQLERSSEALTQAATVFLETGLRRNGVAVVFVATATRVSILEQLSRNGLDVDQLQATNRLIVVEGESALDRLMESGTPDWNEFQRLVGSILDRAAATGEGDMRVYGEMVNMLWHRGRADAAIKLEEYWNRIARKYRFSLFCGYVMDGHDRECYESPLHEIGRTHTDVLGTSEDEAFREALDLACKDVYGIPAARLLQLSSIESRPGEHRLPPCWRTLHWILRAMPVSGDAVLAKTLRFYRDSKRSVNVS